MFLSQQDLIVEFLCEHSDIIIEIENNVCGKRHMAEMTTWPCIFLLDVFSSSVKLSSFALASKARIILHNSHLCTIFSRKH